jgi:hypothetical protein
MTVLAWRIGRHQLRARDLRRARDGPPRREAIFEQTYPSAAHPSLDVIAEKFLTAAAGASARAPASISGASVSPARSSTTSAAPPTSPGSSMATRWRRSWGSRARGAGQRLPRAALGVTAVEPHEWWRWAADVRVARGRWRFSRRHRPGTASLLWSAAQNRYQVVPSEGGPRRRRGAHAAGARARRILTGKYGRVSCERVLPAGGLVDAFKFLSEEPACRGLIPPREPPPPSPRRQRPAAENLSTRDRGYGSPLRSGVALFLLRAGAVAGNLGLMVAGDRRRYVAGGIAPRISRSCSAVASRGVRQEGTAPHRWSNVSPRTSSRPPAGLAGRASSHRSGIRSRRRGCDYCFFCSAIRFARGRLAPNIRRRTRCARVISSKYSAPRSSAGAQRSMSRAMASVPTVRARRADGVVSRAPGYRRQVRTRMPEPERTIASAALVGTFAGDADVFDV